MKRILTAAVLTAAATGTLLLPAAPAHAAGYCNGHIDYACTDRSDGYTFCTLWLDGCYIGL